MDFISLSLQGSYLIKPIKHEDIRGFFTRIFCIDEFSQLSLRADLKQCSISYNKKKGTLRGMHFQNKPFEEDKIIQCICGSIYDVIVDIRPDSETFKKWVSVELSAKNNYILYVPKGFAHGFQTLEDNSSVLYFMTEKFVPASACGFSYDDKSVNVDWPVKEKIISEKDQNLPDLYI